MYTKIAIEGLKQLIQELAKETYQHERNGLAKAALGFVDDIENKANDGETRTVPALPIQNVTNSLKAIELTHAEAKHVNMAIRDKEDMDGEIVGYLLEVLIKIEEKFPDIES